MRGHTLLTATRQPLRSRPIPGRRTAVDGDNGGNTVTHNGRTWRAKWGTQGETPGGGSGVWEDLGPCA